MYIDPTYKGTADEKGIQQLLQVKKNFDTKKANAAKINELKKELNQQYNLITINDLKRIKKLLPDHMDNVKLIVDIQRIGYDSRNNIRIGDISLSKNEDKGGKKGEIKVVGKKGYDSVILNFSFTSNYAAFKRFMEDLRKSLRIVDVMGVNITSASDETKGGLGVDNYKFNIALKTYWLNDNNLN